MPWDETDQLQYRARCGHDWTFRSIHERFILDLAVLSQRIDMVQVLISSGAKSFELPYAINAKELAKSMNSAAIAKHICEEFGIDYYGEGHQKIFEARPSDFEEILRDFRGGQTEVISRRIEILG